MLTEYYFSKLNTNERAYYDKIKSSLARGLSGCALNGATFQEAKNAWKAVNFDHPEIFNYSGLSVNLAGRGNMVEVPLVYAAVDAAAYNAKLGEVLNDLQSAIPPDATRYRACQTIYEYLVKRVKYDDDAMEAYSRLGEPTAQQMQGLFDTYGKSFTAYGALVDGKAVCFGIARAFKILCDRLGVQCAIAEAQGVRHGEPHALNVVELDDDARAFADLTNGLPNRGFKRVRFDFFAVSHRVLARQFTDYQDGCSSLSEFGCNDDSLSWFARNGMRFTSAYAVRKFLEGYAIPSQGNVIRFMLDSGEVDDAWIRRAADRIINAHCGEDHSLTDISVINGVCNAEIQ